MRWALLAALSWIGAGVAHAADAPSCTTQPDLMDTNAWLRALSLDLRGVVPTVEEYAALQGRTEVPGELIQEWLASEDFAWQVVRHHRSLLWPNVTDIRLLSNRQRLLYDEEEQVYYRYLVAPNYRGCPIPCGDFEAEYGPDGELLTRLTDDGCVQEGWVTVNPYWNMDTRVRVCAFEAQEALVSPWGTECDTYDGRYDPHCGCGPNLAWCDTFNLGHNGGNPNPPVAVSIAGDIEHRIAAIVQADQSYLEVLTGRTMYVNGPLVHFLKWQTRVPAHIRFNEVPVPEEILPDLAFEDTDTWVPIQLGEEQAGILTSMAYLMKFQSRRSRANRFYNAFLCQPFQPPSGGITGLDDPHPPMDLTQRDGCNGCHAILEPAAAHWGRWGEYATGYLDPGRFPAFSEECAWCAQTGESCSPECTQFYVTRSLADEEDPWLGWLGGYEFIEERHVPNIETGPRLLVNSTVMDGRLPTCVAARTAEWLLGREMEALDEAWIGELASGFAASGFSYQRLVMAIVTSEHYRRIR